jgi:hypothetical protein
MHFLDTADKLRILVHKMPAHSTHRLQPLDIGIFGALSTAYSNQLNSLQHKSLGLVSLTKRLFYSLFREAFKEAFTSDRIEHAFEKAGIWPFNPAVVLNKLQRLSIPASITSLKLQTPISYRVVRRIHREYKINRSPSKLALILRGHERLAAQHSINTYVITSLHKAFKIEKKKSNKSKRLSLIGKEDNGGPMFFSPSQINTARVLLADKEDEEAVERQLKADDKARKALEKEANEIAKKERAQERLRKREEAKIEKDRKALER